jgi:hypothetical protein
MVSLFTLLDLRNVLLKPGCPICQIRKKSVRRYIDVLVYERVNDVDPRIRYREGMGYCPEHTRLVAATGQKTEEKPREMNILYKSLAGFVKEVISEYPIPRKRPNLLRLVILRLFRSRFSLISTKDLTSKSTCRICQIADESALLGLETLMQCLQDPREQVYTLFPNSDGICLPHLRTALQVYAARYPSATLILKDYAVNCLQHWEQDMGEYIRKQALQDRHEKVLPEEETAWFHAVAFFTGDNPSTVAIKLPKR